MRIETESGSLIAIASVAANAKLCAAAPDLLEALQMPLTEYKNMVHENRQDTFILENVYNAIAKALGE